MAAIKYNFRQWVLTVATTACLLVNTVPARGGSGTMRPSGGATTLIDFCVSLRFNATPTEIDKIKALISAGSLVLADATDGQFAFGRVDIVNDFGAGRQAELWILPGWGRAFATWGMFGVPGNYITTYYTADYNSSSAALGYTVAHEFIHHIWSVGDEYAGPMGDAECEPSPGSSMANYSIMDNYRTRGGRSVFSNFTLNELCVVSNHDPDMDTWQQTVNGESCWQTIATHPKWPGIIPSGLPDDAPPMFITAPVFQELTAERRVVVCIDRSFSMGNVEFGGQTRMGLAQQSARYFTTLVQSGDRLGVTSFNQTSTTDYPLTLITTALDRTLAINAINGLSPSGDTSVGSGLVESRDLLTGVGTPSCASTILLLSDGFSTQPPSELSVLPSLIDNRISVIAVAIGALSDDAMLSQIASDTGGRFLKVADGVGLLALMVTLAVEADDGGVIAFTPGQVSTNKTVLSTALIDAATTEAVFSLVWPDFSDDFSLTLKSPNGNIVDASSGNNPDVDILSDEGVRMYAVRGQTLEQGEWEVQVFGNAINGAGTFDMVSSSNTDAIGFSVATDAPTYEFPQHIKLRAVPRFEGQSVVGAEVSGHYTRPDLATGNLTFFDDGTNGDEQPGDGTYTTLFTNFDGTGVYNFDVAVKNDNGVTYGGEALHDSVPPVIVPVPPFTRTAKASALVTGLATGIDLPLQAKSNAELFQNHPNPFNPTTAIQFTLPASGRAVLKVFDTRGTLVATLLDEVVAAGPHSVEWDGKNNRGERVGSGVYFYRLQTSGETLSRKMVLLK